MEEGATSQCRRPLEAGKPCDSQQGNSELSPQTQRTNYAKKVNEKGNRLFLEPPEMNAHLFTLAW